MSTVMATASTRTSSKKCSVQRRRSSFLVNPRGNGKHKASLENVLPLLLLPLLLGRQGLLFAWVIYQYPLQSVFSVVRHYCSKSGTHVWVRVTRVVNTLENKFLRSSTASLLNQIIFFTLADKCLGLDKRTSLYSLIVYNFLAYSIQYLAQLRAQGQQTWASVAISDSTNIRHLAMSATKLVLEWTKLVTFMATFVTLLIVLHLDSSTFTTNLLPPLKYTILTIIYYLLTEEKLGIPLGLRPTFERIQGLEPLYFQALTHAVAIGLNMLFLLPLLKANPKLCLVAAYHNVYLQFKNLRRVRLLIDKEWGLIKGFREAGEEELTELDDLCSVCLTPLQSRVRVTPCRHYLHANCLRLYLRESRLDSCPICKRPILL